MRSTKWSCGVAVMLTFHVVSELQGATEQKENLLEEAHTHMETLRRGEGILQNSSTLMVHPLVS